MQRAELTAGTIEYEDTGGDGPVVVLLHGLLMDHTLWRAVTADLRADHRVVVPVLPVGSHRIPMRPAADLSMQGLARIVADVLDALDLRDVTLVGNDLGVAQVVAADHPDRLGALVLTSQEAFHNIPPGLPGRFAGLATKLPGGIAMAARSLRIRALQRSPTAFGWMSNAPIPKDMIESWTRETLRQKGVREDLRRYVATTDVRTVLVDAAERLRGFDRPALVAWSEHDRVMPLEHGRRLAELLPQGRLVTIPGARVLVPLDQPAVLSRLIREFVAERRPAAV
jgi:pimeloyl-ACP methyl ester carboxylesterase